MLRLGNGRDVFDSSCRSFTVIFLILVSNLGDDIADVLADILADDIIGRILNGLTIMKLYAGLRSLSFLDLSMDGLYILLVDTDMMEVDACIDWIEDAS